MKISVLLLEDGLNSLSNPPMCQKICFKTQHLGAGEKAPPLRVLAVPREDPEQSRRPVLQVWSLSWPPGAPAQMCALSFCFVCSCSHGPLSLRKVIGKCTGGAGAVVKNTDGSGRGWCINPSTAESATATWRNPKQTNERTHTHLDSTPNTNTVPQHHLCLRF